MDSITQVVLGAAVGEAVAGRKMGGKAAFWGAIGGTIPDLDVFLRFLYDPFDAALVHRGFSHSILFALLISPVLAWFFQRVSKNDHGFKTWFWLWFLSIFTHPVLDMFTNYGTQFLWPFDWRITFNTVFVVDPLYTLPFAIFLIRALFIKRTDPRRKKWNMAGIYYSSAYLLVGVGIKLALLSQVSSYFGEKNIIVKRSVVTPMPLTSFYWDMIVESDSAYYVGYKSLFAHFDTARIEMIPKNHDLLRKAKWQIPNRIDRIAHITNGFYSVRQAKDTLFVYDLRFGTTTRMTNQKTHDPLMGYILLQRNGVITEAQFLRSRSMKHVDFGQYMREVFGE